MSGLSQSELSQILNSLETRPSAGVGLHPRTADLMFRLFLTKEQHAHLYGIIGELLDYCSATCKEETPGESELANVIPGSVHDWVELYTSIRWPMSMELPPLSYEILSLLSVRPELPYSLSDILINVASLFLRRGRPDMEDIYVSPEVELIKDKADPEFFNDLAISLQGADYCVINKPHRLKLEAQRKSILSGEGYLPKERIDAFLAGEIDEL
jgi:hypothetical protein